MKYWCIIYLFYNISAEIVIYIIRYKQVNLSLVFDSEASAFKMPEQCCISQIAYTFIFKNFIKLAV